MAEPEVGGPNSVAGVTSKYFEYVRLIEIIKKVLSPRLMAHVYPADDELARARIEENEYRGGTSSAANHLPVDLLYGGGSPELPRQRGKKAKKSVSPSPSSPGFEALDTEK
jgi:hypothetical protein